MPTETRLSKTKGPFKRRKRPEHEIVYWLIGICVAYAAFFGVLYYVYNYGG